MVSLEFVLDDVELAELSRELPAVDPAALQETYLITPVRLCVGSAELLRVRGLSPQDPPFLRLPLLHVATIGAACVRSLTQEREARYSLPGTGVSLQFERSASEVCIRSELNEQTACVSLAELLEAVDSFVDQVKAALRVRVPGLGQIEEWQSWLEG